MKRAILAGAVALVVVAAGAIATLGLVGSVSSNCRATRTAWDSARRVIIAQTTPARLTAKDRRILRRIGLTPGELARSSSEQRRRLEASQGGRPAC